MLSKHKFNIDYESIGTNDYFPGNINGATLILNPKNNNIWVADWHKQRIDIIDTALCLIKQIRLPQSKMLNISVKELPNISMLNYDDQLIYKAFAGFTATKDYVYIVNENINGVNSDMYENNELQPVEIYQFNWDGELVKVYKLNKYASNVSVSSCGDYLYCTAKDKLYGEPYLIRYKL